ncbi:MAG: malonate decarboxylase subunit alpha [Dehalococcoidia bacterium]
MKVISAEEAAALLPSGATVTVSGLMGNLVPETVLAAVERRFLETGQPRDITELHPWLYGWEDGTGLNRWAHPGLLKRIIGSTYILPTFSKTAQINRMILDGEVEGYCWPANAIFQTLRAIGAGRKGFATTVGIDTFADPRRDGGRLNSRAKDDLIDVVSLAGEEHLFYRSFPIDVALIRASTADSEGNLSCDEDGLTQGILLQATAARNSGGVVIAQVKRVVEAGSIHPLMVEVPGAVVDYVVVDESALQWQYGANRGDHPATTGARRLPLPDVAYPPHSVEKVVARRALQEIKPGDLVNVGAGIPTALMPATALEEHLQGKIRWSVEHGVFGGHCLAATHWNPTAITTPAWLLDFYSGGGLDHAFLAMPEVDRFGNVNVGRLGDQLPCPGGFTDISTTARRMTFCGTMTGDGLVAEADAGKLVIHQEGRYRRFVNDVQMVCFSGRQALAAGHDVMYITERAVFRLTPEGLRLDEVAPGIDVQAQILELCQFELQVSADLKLMDERLFRPEPLFLGLQA